MISILRPIIFAFLTSNAVKELLLIFCLLMLKKLTTLLMTMLSNWYAGSLTLKKKATEDQFNELHNLVTEEFLARIKSGEATTQDLKAACDWLKTNDISGVAV